MLCKLLLCRANALTKAQATTATTLVDAGDVFVRQVFERYEKDGNLGALLGGLRDLSVPVTSYNLSVGSNRLIRVFLCLFVFMYNHYNCTRIVGR